VYEIAREVGCPAGGVLFVLGALSDARKEHFQRERGSDAGHLKAQEFCEYLLRCRGDDTLAVMRELGLRRSEDVGSIVFRLVTKGLVCRQESDLESDFNELFVVD
jgi:uncharacterized repeat protein (TIGR04138 family)